MTYSCALSSCSFNAYICVQQQQRGDRLTQGVCSVCRGCAQGCAQGVYGKSLYGTCTKSLHKIPAQKGHREQAAGGRNRRHRTHKNHWRAQ